MFFKDAARYFKPGAASSSRATSSGLRITGSLRGSRALFASVRPSVTVKKKRNAETAAFILVAEARFERMAT